MEKSIKIPHLEAKITFYGYLQALLPINNAPLVHLSVIFIIVQKILIYPAKARIVFIYFSVTNRQ